MPRTTTAVTTFLMTMLAASVHGLDTVRRYALVAGSNDGGAPRAPLRYAVSDAESFASVMTTLGGVEDTDLFVLQQPSLLELEDALHELRSRIAATSSDRSEVFLYFSGHANETGLLLGDETFSYRSLRNWMELAEADVRIAVLDACASGAVTRRKGGKRRKPFLVDASSDTRGHAFLTSSTADEVAQESDRIGASFFTHYLISGLRGAADTSGEGKVTLSEAYQFAFHETLGRTAETQAGAQHPAYDIALSGTGDVVMTDLRQTGAELVLDETVTGRLFVRNAHNRLVVELNKPTGRRVALGLEPGAYTIRSERAESAFLATTAVADGASVVLLAEDFAPTTREAAVARGAPKATPRFGGMDGRWQLGPQFLGLELGGARHSFAAHPKSRCPRQLRQLRRGHELVALGSRGRRARLRDGRFDRRRSD